MDNAGEIIIKYGSYAAGIAAILGLAIKFNDIKTSVSQWMKNRKDKKYAVQNKTLEEIQGISSKFSAIQSDISEITSDVRNLKERIDSVQEDVESVHGDMIIMQKNVTTMQDDIVVSQRTDLKQLYGKYKNWGWCTLEEKQGFLDLYDRYHTDQKHNSLVDTMRQDIENLPTEPTKGSPYYHGK